MKIQHILFVILLAFLIWKRKPAWTAGLGLLLLVLSIPLFAKYVFYTAESMTWYAAGLFLLTFIQQTYRIIRSKPETQT